MAWSHIVVLLLCDTVGCELEDCHELVFNHQFDILVLVLANAYVLISFPFRYDTEATYFDEGVRSSKRKQLEEKLLQVMILLLLISEH